MKERGVGYIKTKYTRAGAMHIHKLDPFAPNVRSAASTPAPVEAPVSNLAAIEVRDGVYSSFIREYLKLNSEDRSDLHARGFDDPAIQNNGYVSTPTRDEAQKIVREMVARFDLDGVPGFFREGNEFRLVGMWPGYFIPYRDERLRIQALSYRRRDWTKGDEVGKYIWLSSKDKPNGAGSGAPLHWSKPHLIQKEIICIEGGLKADVCSHFLNVPCVAAGGVTQFGPDFGERLKQQGIARAIICFDGDWRRNPAVRLALTTLRDSLDDVGVEYVVRVWSKAHKGYDDYLLASLCEGRREAA